MSLTDPLTGLPNRRYLEERLFEEVERSKRYNTPLSFMIIDVDHFKRYNDVYGPPCGPRFVADRPDTTRLDSRDRHVPRGLRVMSFASCFRRPSRRIRPYR